MSDESPTQIPLELLRSSQLVDDEIIGHLEDLVEEAAPLHQDCLTCARVRKALAEISEGDVDADAD